MKKETISKIMGFTFAWVSTILICSPIEMSLHMSFGLVVMFSAGVMMVMQKVFADD